MYQQYQKDLYGYAPSYDPKFAITVLSPNVNDIVQHLNITSPVKQ